MTAIRFATGLLLFVLAMPASADDETILREFKTVLWPDAYRNQNVALLDRMLHDTFVVITDSGEVSTKQDELEFLRNNDWDPGEFEYRIDRLDIFDSNVAIISGRGFAETYTYTSSNVLIKEDGRWQAIGSHVSGVERVGLPENAAFHALSVRDIDRSITWYEEHLDFTVLSRASNEQRKGAVLSRPGTLLEVAEFDGALPLAGLVGGVEPHQVHGIFKLGFVVTDLDAAFDQFESAGVDIFFPIVATSNGDRTFGIRDPDGNIVQFFGN